MLIPRYYFAEDFRAFYKYFSSQPHEKKNFKVGEFLWQPGAPYEKIHYIISGVGMHYADHESGKRKIISFHGPGTVFPGYRLDDFHVELSLTTVALTEMEVLEFTVPQFKLMFETNTKLSECVIKWYSMYVNMLLFETMHQTYNHARTKLCNLLYLLTINNPSSFGSSICITQDVMAELLGISRIQISRELAVLRQKGIIETRRGEIIISDFQNLAAMCTEETI